MGRPEGQHKLELMGYGRGTQVHDWEWTDALLVVLDCDSCWSCLGPKTEQLAWSRVRRHAFLVSPVQKVSHARSKPLDCQVKDMASQCTHSKRRNKRSLIAQAKQSTVWRRKLNNLLQIGSRSGPQDRGQLFLFDAA